MNSIIYLDESGDLGWTLDKPYRYGGSSRYLTIAAVAVPPSQTKHIARAVRYLYSQHGWDTKKEKKWANMTPAERISFAETARQLHTARRGVRYLAISVRKENVYEHIRQDSNKLYNYMVRLLLADHMAQHQFVKLIPDARSLRVHSGHSLHEYLQSQLWFDCNAPTKLHTEPTDSDQSLHLQYADMLSGAVQSHVEDRKSDPWRILRPLVHHQRLYERAGPQR